MTDTQHFSERLAQLFQAGHAAFFVKTQEEARLDALLSEFAAGAGLAMEEWNQAYGWVAFDTKRPGSGDGLFQPRLAEDLAAFLERDFGDTLCVVKDLRLALQEDKHALARLRDLLLRLRDRRPGKMTLVLVSDAMAMPHEIASLVTMLDLPLPGRADLDRLVTGQAGQLGLEVPTELRPRLVAALSGMAEHDARLVLRRLRDQGAVLSPAMIGIALEEKRQLVRKSGLLEMVEVDIANDAVGGLDLFKDWLGRQAMMVQRLDEAIRAGLQLPKGVLLSGMPGCGKSLSAKYAALALGQPLLRLDVGSLLGKYVGESEQNLRRALAVAEAMSPCVLWIDELDKAFAGRAGAQSEVNASMLGYLLNWLQEKRGPVFVFATANDIGVLPPELLRKGRFDELFYVGFPNQAERKEIFEVRLRTHEPVPERFDLDELARESSDFSGADISAAVDAARGDSFLAGVTLQQAPLLAAIRKCVPMKRAMAQQIEVYQELFKKHHLKPASSSDAGSAQVPSRHAYPDLLRLSEVQLMELAGVQPLSVEAITFLVRHRSEQVRAAAGRNAKLDRLSELRLARDEDALVRAALASNPWLSAEAQCILSDDASELVRMRLAKNRSIGGLARNALARDASSRVRNQLAKRGEILPIAKTGT
jgi:MoxR-like ATPase